jgi:peptide/nickel transport system substrate-binding protein
MTHRQFSRRDFLKLGVAGATATVWGSFAGSYIAQDENLQSNNFASHVTIGNTSIQANLNPFGFIYFQARQIYDTLIETTADGQLIPGLATEWNQVDPQTLEVQLRDDVFFSNGERFTARSVQFTLEFLRSQIADNYFTFYVPITDLLLAPPNPLLDGESIEVIDDTRLVVKTTRPDPILAKRLSRLFILPEEHMTTSENAMTTDAVGTGYFKIADFVPGERIDFETWDGNWRGDLPIQTATYVTVGDLRTALESGAIDIAQSMAPDIAREMASSDEWRVSENPALATGIIDMIPDTHPALQDVRVRRALNLAINKEEYNDIILAGFGTVATGQILPPGFDGYNDELEAFPYDPEEARRLLDEAGYSDLSLSLFSPNTTQAQAEAVAGYFRAVGIDIELDLLDSNAVINEVRSGTEYNLLLWQSNYVTLGDWSQAVNPFTIPALVQPHIDNDEFYELNDQITAAETVEERTELVQEIAELMYEDASVVFLSWESFIYVHTSRIEAVPFNLDTSPRMHAIRMREA